MLQSKQLPAKPSCPPELARLSPPRSKLPFSLRPWARVSPRVCSQLFGDIQRSGMSESKKLSFLVAHVAQRPQLQLSRGTQRSVVSESGSRDCDFPPLPPRPPAGSSGLTWPKACPAVVPVSRVHSSTLPELWLDASFPSLYFPTT